MTSSATRPDRAPLALVRHTAAGTSWLEAGEGLPLVLLHGIPGSALTWADAGAHLAHRYRVILPDLAGFGRSDPPAGDYYMEAQARHIRALLARLGISHLALGGHDFGAPVALTLHRLFPELEIRALVLSATNLFTDTPVPAPLRLARVGVLGTAFFRLIAGNRAGLRLMYQAAAADKRAVPWASFRRHLTASGMELTRRIFQRSLADLPGNYGAIEASLRSVAVPSLVLWGDRDPFFAVAVGERTCRAIPGATLRVLERTGHFVPEERPGTVADEIRTFLEAVQVARAKR